jgi:hypothetical protein
VRPGRAFALAALFASGACTYDFGKFQESAGAAREDSGGITPGDAAVPDAASGDAGSSSSGGGGPDSGIGMDAAQDAADAGRADVGAPVDAAPADAAADGGDITSGLVAYYKFDESSGTSAADSSGNGNTATLSGGATFSAGVQGNALTLSGTSQYAVLPAAVVGGFTAYSVAAWVNPSAVPNWSRVFDFGSGTTSYMFLTPSNGTSFRFGISTGGATREQQLNANSLATGRWQHVVVTLGSSTGTLYVDGSVVARSTNLTLTPSSLGTTTQNWIGRSEYAADPYFSGQIDNFRIYSRVLATADVQMLATGHL